MQDTVEDFRSGCNVTKKAVKWVKFGYRIGYHLPFRGIKCREYVENVKYEETKYRLS